MVEFELSYFRALARRVGLRVETSYLVTATTIKKENACPDLTLANDSLETGDSLFLRLGEERSLSLLFLSTNTDAMCSNSILMRRIATLVQLFLFVITYITIYILFSCFGNLFLVRVKSMSFRDIIQYRFGFRCSSSLS